MYEMADDSWRRQPEIMSAETISATARRIADHVKNHQLPDIQIILHGGEPLLPGPGYVDATATVLRDVIGANVDLRVQTNGTLMSDSMLDVLLRHDIRIGVSLDGDQQANDEHRRYASGRGSHDRVARSLHRIRDRAPHLLAGLLCTIDLRNDPVATYEALQEFQPPVIDFLLPHGNWTSPPPGRDPAGTDAPYGRWLATVFDHWYSLSPAGGRVRMFSEIIHAMLGGQARVESIGLAPVRLIVVDADGTLEQVDTLRSAYAGAAGTGLSVHTHDLETAARHPAIVARQRGRDGLSETCRACALHPVCGGGLYAHRYRAGSGFMNPSVYCPDLAFLIGHIHRRVSGDLASVSRPSREALGTARGNPMTAAAGAPATTSGAQAPSSGVPASTLTSAELAALADGGYEEQRLLEKVYASQLTKHRLLIGAVARFGGRAVPAAAATLSEHYDLLAAAERTAPDAVAAVLGYPHVGAWAAQSMRWLSKDPGSAAAILGYLGAIAASAAIQAGHGCSVSLPLADGALTLPGIGRVVLPGTHATVTVSGPGETAIAAGGRVIAIPLDPGADVPGWQAARVLAFGDRTLLLDDLDPHRSYEPYPLPGRLRDGDVAHWQQALDEAWRLLTRYQPGYAAALGGGLRSLVPIGQRADDRNVSATSGDAFGAVAASVPSDGAALAVALMHEFQHTKLCAVNDLEPLVSRSARQSFYAPWRPDPRPAGALLHGIYAHMAVADFWRIHRRVAMGGESLLAHVEFARWLRQAHHAAGLLDGHDELTGAGHQLLARVLARLTAWLEEPVPPLARKLADETAADHLSCWRLRNLEPEPGDIERLARDWHAGRPGHGVVRTRMRAEPLTAGRNVRPDLLYLRLRDPDRFDRDTTGADASDAAWARGDQAAAARGYLAQLEADPARLHAWTGLGIVTGPHSALTLCPEVAYALHDRIARDRGPSAGPLRVARWLSSVSIRDLEVHV
jgi:uncharacterized protein